MATASPEPSATPIAPALASELVARIERIPFCSWHVKMRLVIGVATLFEGFNLLSISYVLPVLVPAWHLSAAQAGALIGIGFLGGAISTFLMGWFAERFGRKRAILVCTAAFSVASLLCAFAWNFDSMMLFRFLQGLGGGGEVPIAVTYITEVSRAQGRGRFILLYELIFPIGLVLAAVVGWWLVAHVAWQWMFLIGAVPALVLVRLQRALPESPRWLVQQGRQSEATAVVEAMEAAAVRATGRPLPPPPALALESPIESTRSFWRELMGAGYRGRTLMIWAVVFFCYLMNYAMAGWLPTLYGTMFHLSVDRSLAYSLVTTATGLAGTLLCALLIDVVGRRAWFTWAFAASAVVMFWVWQRGTGTPEALMLSGSVGYFFISTISIGVFLYMPEIYPTRLRARATCIATVWNTIAGVVGPSLVGTVLGTHGLAAVFGALAVVAVLGAATAGLFAVETRGRVLEQVSP